MEIKKEDFAEYERVRKSGVTNMFNVSMVCDLTGLEKDTIMNIMGQYTELAKKYPEVVA